MLVFLCQNFFPQTTFRVKSRKFWFAFCRISDNVGQWIQVDLKTPTYVTGVATQGRYNYPQWVTSYKISYGNSPNALQNIQDRNGRDLVSPLVAH